MSVQAAPVVPILLMAAAIVVLGALLSASTSVDLAGPVRSWLWRRDARRMRRSQRFPQTLHRAYWSRRQYERDSRTLTALGYRVTSEQAADPYITLPSLPTFGRTMPRQRRRRVPVIYVDYAHEAHREANAAAARR